MPVQQRLTARYAGFGPTSHTIVRAAVLRMPISWSQHYTPLGSLGVSALVAALPVVVLLALLGFWHVRAHVAAVAGLASALGIALFVFSMPTSLALAAAGDGALYGFFPIGWIVLNAIFVYSILPSPEQTTPPTARNRGRCEHNLDLSLTPTRLGI